MTPPAVTPAAKPRSTGHPSKLRRQAAPRSLRRISGPVGGRSAATAPQPARVRTRTAPARRQGAPLLERSAAFVRSLPDHSLLDRIIRGRAWIPLIGVLLAGIVAMQVEVLKLNAGIGRSLERGTALQSQNALLRARVATLADDGRIEAKAARMGMVMPAPASIKFLSLGKNAAVTRAVTNVHQPDATAFSSALTASGIGVSTSDGASTTAATSDTTPSSTASESSDTTPTSSQSSDATPTTPMTSGSSDATATSSGSSDVAAAAPGSAATPVAASTPVAAPTDSSSSIGAATP